MILNCLFTLVTLQSSIFKRNFMQYSKLQLERKSFSTSLNKKCLQITFNGEQKQKPTFLCKLKSMLQSLKAQRSLPRAIGEKHTKLTLHLNYFLEKAILHFNFFYSNISLQISFSYSSVRKLANKFYTLSQREINLIGH